MAIAKYLKERLERIAGIRSELDRIESKENRDDMKARHGADGVYPSMFGELSAVVQIASIDTADTARSIEAVERLERIEAIFLDLDIDLGEESLKAMELMSTRDYREQQRAIRDAVSRAVRETQEAERDYEHDQATDALVEAGFAPDESGEYFDRGSQRVTIELTNGRQCRYAWELQDNSSGEQITVDSGKSGEFARLIEAIAPKVAEVEA